MTNVKVCKFYVKGKCTQKNCNFQHIDNICKFYFFDGKCNHYDNCKFSHEYTLMKKRPKNTENFIPNHNKPNMCVKIGDSNFETYQDEFNVNDVNNVNNPRSTLNGMRSKENTASSVWSNSRYVFLLAKKSLAFWNYIS